LISVLTLARKYGSRAAFAIMVERQWTSMETSFPLSSWSREWHIAQLLEPAKLPVSKLTRGSPAWGAMVVVGRLVVGEVVSSPVPQAPVKPATKKRVVIRAVAEVKRPLIP
jgi:hypothetical protein